MRNSTFLLVLLMELHISCSYLVIPFVNFWIYLLVNHQTIHLSFLTIIRHSCCVFWFKKMWQSSKDLHWWRLSDTLKSSLGDQSVWHICVKPPLCLNCKKKRSFFCFCFLLSKTIWTKSGRNHSKCSLEADAVAQSFILWRLFWMAQTACRCSTRKRHGLIHKKGCFEVC